MIALISALGCSAADEVKAEPVAAAALVDATTPSEAAEAAVGESDLGFLSRSQLVDIVEATCASMAEDVATPEVAEQVVRTFEGEVENLTADQVQSAASMLATLVPKACPDEVQVHPDLINEVVAIAPTTTTTTTTTTTSPPTTIPPTTAAPTTIPPTTAAPVTAPPPPSGGDTYYANCTEVRAAGAAPILVGEPGYASKLDRDGDGIACE